MHIWGAAVFKLYNWRMCFSSSKVLERLGILKHDFSIFDDGDFEDVRTTWRERCRRWGSRTSVNIGRSGEPREGGGVTVEFSRSRLLWRRDRVHLLLLRPLR